MSLEARILALAQSVGADIKTLNELIAQGGGGGTPQLKTINGQSLIGSGDIIIPSSFRNRLINGNNEVNQRAFNGNWGSISNGNYGYDRWRRNGAGQKTQIIEAVNFKPATVHTLSGTGVTTQQITSPASGNWTINVPNSATKIMLEEGTEARPYEVLPIAVQIVSCLRYLQYVDFRWAGVATAANQTFTVPILLPMIMRATPTVYWSIDGTFTNVKDPQLYANSSNSAYMTFQSNAAGPIAFPLSWLDFMAEF